LDLYNSLLKEFLKEDQPKTSQEISQILQAIRDITLEKFSAIAGSRERNEFYKNYQNKLKEVLDSKELKTMDINEKMNSE